MDTPHKPIPFDVDEYRGRQNLLLLFAPSDRSPAYQTQMDLVQEEAATFDAHDILLVQVMDEGDSYVNDRKMDPAAAEQLRERFEAGHLETFCLILVGRDGTELHRDDTPMQAKALLARFEEAGASSASGPA